MAISEKKNPPKNDDVIEEALKLAGDLHYPEEFKFDDIGTIDHEETYYHAFIGYNDDGTYRVLFFDNDQTNLITGNFPLPSDVKRSYKNIFPFKRGEIS